MYIKKWRTHLRTLAFEMVSNKLERDSKLVSTILISQKEN